MLGAIIGDIVGSYYEVLEINTWIKNHEPRSYQERIKIMDSSTPLFTDMCSMTDDSILTCAILDAILNGNCQYEEYLRTYALKEISLGMDQYGRSRFGKGFISWLKEEKEGNSFGNGAAMRISPVGFVFDTLDEVLLEAKNASICSHNHPDAILGAEAVASSIFLLRSGKTKEEVMDYVRKNYYPLDYSLEELRHHYTFSSRSDTSVPQALFCFFLSNSYENSIRTAISIGGDSDTIACIAGGLAESYYGVPSDIVKKAEPYLNKDAKRLVKEFYQGGNKNGKRL